MTFDLQRGAVVRARATTTSDIGTRFSKKCPIFRTPAHGQADARAAVCAPQSEALPEGKISVAITARTRLERPDVRDAIRAPPGEETEW
jgi:hypothetical protein